MVGRFDVGDCNFMHVIFVCVYGEHYDREDKPNIYGNRGRNNSPVIIKPVAGFFLIRHPFIISILLQPESGLSHISAFTLSLSDILLAPSALYLKYICMEAVLTVIL